MCVPGARLQTTNQTTKWSVRLVLTKRQKETQGIQKVARGTNSCQNPGPGPPQQQRGCSSFMRGGPGSARPEAIGKMQLHTSRVHFMKHQLANAERSSINRSGSINQKKTAARHLEICLVGSSVPHRTMCFHTRQHFFCRTKRRRARVVEAHPVFFEPNKHWHVPPVDRARVVNSAADTQVALSCLCAISFQEP